MDQESWLRDFPIGSKARIGDYCDCVIVGISKLKGYGPIIKLTPSYADPIGAQTLRGQLRDVSYKAISDLKRIGR